MKNQTNFYSDHNFLILSKENQEQNNFLTMQENLNQMEKITFQKSSNFVDNNFPSHSSPASYQPQIQTSQPKQGYVDDSDIVKNEEDQYESPTEGELRQNQSANSFRTEQQILKIQRELEEIERLQKQRLNEQLYKTKNQSSQKMQHSFQSSSVEQNQKTQINEIHFNNQNAQQIGTKLNFFNEQKKHKEERREQIILEFSPEKQSCLQNEDLHEDNKKKLISDEGFLNSAKEQKQTTLSNQNENNPQVKQEINQPYPDPNNENNKKKSELQDSQIKMPQNYQQNIATEGQCQNRCNPNSEKPLSNNSLNQSKQSINSCSSAHQKLKIIEQLNQELVHKVTDNLENIFELFRVKLPQTDEIQIIRKLYIKYIEPQKTQKPKETNIQKITFSNIENKQIEKRQDIVATRAPHYIANTNPNGQKRTLDQLLTDLEPRDRVHEMPIPKRNGQPSNSKNINVPIKRSYTKRGGQGSSNTRFLDEQKVAKLFIKKGYGLHVARQHLGLNIQNNHYTNLITTIIRETWRKIQEYVSRFRKIKAMSTNQFKVIKTSLVNCLKWMDQTDLQTLYGFMKVCYQMDNRFPYQEESIRLYNNCIRRYQEFRIQSETQTKIRMEKKNVQKVKPDGKPILSKPPVIKPTFHGDPNRGARNLPSGDELRDLTSLIKIQLRQSNPNQAYNQQPQMRPPQPQMRPPQPQMRPPQPQMRPPQQQYPPQVIKQSQLIKQPQQYIPQIIRPSQQGINYNRHIPNGQRF